MLVRFSFIAALCCTLFLRVVPPVKVLGVRDAFYDPVVATVSFGLFCILLWDLVRINVLEDKIESLEQLIP